MELVLGASWGRVWKFVINGFCMCCNGGSFGFSGLGCVFVRGFGVWLCYFGLRGSAHCKVDMQVGFGRRIEYKGKVIGEEICSLM